MLGFWTERTNIKTSVLTKLISKLNESMLLESQWIMGWIYSTALDAPSTLLHPDLCPQVATRYGIYQHPLLLSGARLDLANRKHW